MKPAHPPSANPSILFPLHQYASAPTLYHYMPSSVALLLLSCLPLIFFSWATSHSPSVHDHPVPLLPLRPLKETWRLKSAKRSTSKALKRPSAQLIVTETATEVKERRLGPAGERGELERERGCKPGPNEGRDNCFVLLGALLQCGGSWNDTTHMVFGWSGQREGRRDAGSMQEWWKYKGGGCSAEKAVICSAAKKAPKSCNHHATLEWKWFVYWQILKLPGKFDYDHAYCYLPFTGLQEDFNVKIHINHSVVQYHSPQIPTVRKTTSGQAGDTTLATQPGQIYQNLWNGKHMNL